MSEGHVKLIKHADRRVSGMGIVSTEKSLALTHKKRSHTHAVHSN